VQESAREAGKRPQMIPKSDQFWIKISVLNVAVMFCPGEAVAGASKLVILATLAKDKGRLVRAAAAMNLKETIMSAKTIMSCD
jgi:hypothetical protein